MTLTTSPMHRAIVNTSCTEIVSYASFWRQKAGHQQTSLVYCIPPMNLFNSITRGPGDMKS